MPISNYSAFYISNSATSTPIAVQGTPVKIAGTYISGLTSPGFTYLAGGAIRNDTGAAVIVSMLAAVSAMKNNTIICTFIAIDGNIIPSSKSTNLVNGSGDIETLVSSDLINFPAGSKLEVFICNETNTSSVTAKSLNFKVEEVGINTGTGTGSQTITGAVNPTTQGNNGDFYINTITGEYFLKEAGTWNSKGTFCGPCPDENSQTITGAVNPTTQGNDGDFYINTITGEYFLKEAGTWNSKGTFCGPCPTYSNTFIAAAAPTTEGENGDFYINSATGEYFLKSGGTWSLKGDFCSPCPSGGSQTIIEGSAPTTQGSDGDFFINFKTGEYYLKISGVWELKGDFCEPCGDNNNITIVGAVDPTTEGNNGDFYINSETGEYFIKELDIWGSKGDFCSPCPSGYIATCIPIQNVPTSGSYQYFCNYETQEIIIGVSSGAPDFETPIQDISGLLVIGNDMINATAGAPYNLIDSGGPAELQRFIDNAAFDGVFFEAQTQTSGLFLISFILTALNTPNDIQQLYYNSNNNYFSFTQSECNLVQVP